MNRHVRRIGLPLLLVAAISGSPGLSRSEIPCGKMDPVKLHQEVEYHHRRARENLFNNYPTIRVKREFHEGAERLAAFALDQYGIHCGSDPRWDSDYLKRYRTR